MSQASFDLAKQLYDAVLGRDPSAGDQASLAAYLDAGGPGAALIAGSAEAAAGVGAVYQQVLGRAASSTEITVAQGFLAGGGTLAGLREAAAGSREGGAQINQLYLDGLGRNASFADLTAAESYLAGGGTLAGLRTLVGGSREATAVVKVLYQSVLGRGADAADLASAQAAIVSGATLTQFVAGMATSAEEGARLSAAYQAASGQAPNAAGLATMAGQVERDTASGLLATLQQDGPASSVPSPSDFGSFGGAGVQNTIVSLPAAEIWAVSPGTSYLPNTPYTATSGAFTASGDASTNGTRTETITLTASLLGLELPASLFAPATVDANGHWTTTATRGLPDGTYTLLPVVTYANGSTAAGQGATVIVAASTTHSAMSLLLTS